MDIQISDDLPESIEKPPPSSQMLSWAQAAWQGDEKTSPNVSLRIVSKHESQELNANYRNKDKPTNVLSFPMEMEIIEEGLCLLGDLAICAEVVQQEALDQKKTLQHHWAHMLVHGMLHLQGYDHIENKDADEMERLEVKILEGLGFDNPYQNLLLNTAGNKK